VVIWDNLNTHISGVMRERIAARDWLRVIQLPAYAPDLNPTEQVWSHVKRGLGNLIVHGVDHLAVIVRNRLNKIQRRPGLLAGFLAHTGLALEPQPPKSRPFKICMRLMPFTLGQCGENLEFPRRLDRSQLR
jgi:putative transposase